MHNQKHLGFDAPFLDEDEAETMKALDAAHIVPSSKEELEAHRQFWVEAAKATLRKRPVTVEIQERDIRKLEQIAIERGVPYQTLVSSVLHLYAAGLLRETR